MNGGWRWFRRQKAADTAAGQELRGAPKTARVKTYSSETGNVYQYVYRGWRALALPPTGVEHQFEIQRQRHGNATAKIRLLDDELRQCSESIGREVLSAERYALAKLALLQLFDEAELLSGGELMRAPNAAKMKHYLEQLGRL